MTWDVHDAGSYGVAVTDTPADMAQALSLPASWPINAKRCFVRRDQWPNLTPTNPLPVFTSITPAAAVAGSAALPVVIAGSGLTPLTVLRWEGVDYPVTFVNATTLNYVVPASAMVAANIFGLFLFTPPPGGGQSVQRVFTVTATAED